MIDAADIRAARAALARRKSAKRTKRARIDASAVALAMLYPEISADAYQRARTLVRERLDLAREVLAGREFASAAYPEASSAYARRCHP